MSKLGIVLSYKNCCILKHALRDKIQEKEEWLKANSDGIENYEDDKKEFEEEKRALAAITDEINWNKNKYRISSKSKNKKVQCVKCVHQKMEGCNSNDRFELRECSKFNARTERNKIIESRS